MELDAAQRVADELEGLAKLDLEFFLGKVADAEKPEETPEVPNAPITPARRQQLAQALTVLIEVTERMRSSFDELCAVVRQAKAVLDNTEEGESDAAVPKEG